MGLTRKDLAEVSALVADESMQVCTLVASILRGAGAREVRRAKDGADLLALAASVRPTLVITGSRLPVAKISGLAFTRTVRAGHGEVPRTLPIIVMTPTASVAFVHAAREAGVDEMLVRPFTAPALLARVEAVMVRPRRFVREGDYAGPCRRRRMLQDYRGPRRREAETAPAPAVGDAPWERASNRDVVRVCVRRLADLAAGLAPGDRAHIQALHMCVQEAQQTAEDVRDHAMAAAVRSLRRYVEAVGASARFEPGVLAMHIGVLRRLAALGSVEGAERETLVAGLVAVVDGKVAAGAPAPPPAARTRSSAA